VDVGLAWVWLGFGLGAAVRPQPASVLSLSFIKNLKLQW
jgi:hypothetical protein